MEETANHNPRREAFSLIEVLVGITMITVVLTAVTGLLLSTIQSNARNLHAVQAVAYAQEGIEAVRFMRDSNWLQNYSWDEGADLWNASFSLDASDPLTLYLEPLASAPYWSFNDRPEIIEADNGVLFERELSFSSILDEWDESRSREDTVELTVTVSWMDRGIDRSVELSTYLTDWK